MQASVTVRNARLAALKAAIGTSPILQSWTGNAPANCAAADTGTLLAEFTLPSDWLNPESGGTITKLGTWQTTALANGDAGHFRMKESTGTTTHLQGTISVLGGGGDMELDQATLAILTSQTLTVATFTITDGNP